MKLFSPHLALVGTMGASLLSAACQAKPVGVFNIGSLNEKNGFVYDSADIASVNGMHPMRGVGEIYYPGDRWTDLRGFSMVQGESQIVTEAYKAANVTHEHITAIKKKLLAVQSAMAEVAAQAVRENSYEMSRILESKPKDGQAVGAEAKKSQDAADALKKAVDAYESEMKPGVVVWRWAVSSEGKFSVSANPYGALETKSGNGNSGYLIASGITITRLMLGSTPLVGDDVNINQYAFEIPIFSISAKHIAWCVDNRADMALGASISIDKDIIRMLATKDPGAAANVLQKLEGVRASISMARTSMMNSSGQLETPEVLTRSLSTISAGLSVDADGALKANGAPNGGQDSASLEKVRAVAQAADLAGLRNTQRESSSPQAIQPSKDILIFTRSVNLHDLLKAQHAFTNNRCPLNLFNL